MLKMPLSKEGDEPCRRAAPAEETEAGDGTAPCPGVIGVLEEDPVVVAEFGMLAK
jgi:hypothetical protein